MKKAPTQKDNKHHEQLMQSRILIVDDVETSRMILRSFCKSAGFTHIKEAENGLHALEIIATWKPDLILLDFEMPIMNGLDLCHELGQRGIIDDMIIMMQTGTDKIEFRAQAFEAGVTDLLNKPLHARECIARIIAHLERRLLKRQIESDYQRIQQEMREAVIMQNILLPDEALLDMIRSTTYTDLALYYHPASELAGDYLTVRRLSNNRIAIASIDVSGHGVTAALYAFAIHALIEDALLAIYTPNELLTHLNSKLYSIMATGKFATMFLAILDTNTQMMHYSAAAAPSPLLLSAGAITVLETRGTPLGIDNHVEYSTRSIPYKTGDVLFIYSDALIETPDASGKCMTQSDISTVLASMENGSANEIVRGIVIEFYSKFSSQPRDDVTMLACKL